MTIEYKNPFVTIKELRKELISTQESVMDRSQKIMELQVEIVRLKAIIYKLTMG
jgi:hypothetical protein